MKKLLIVFSGTGNSFYLGKLIQQVSSGETDIVLLKHGLILPDLANYDGIGILSPLYYYKLPSIVRKFITETSLPDGRYYFGLITRGSRLEGGALAQASRLFKKRGITLSYARYVHMPLNDVTFYRPDKKNIEKCLDDVEAITPQIVRDIDSKVSHHDFEPLGLLSHLVEPLLFSKPHLMDTHFSIERDACVKCGLCASICPANNIVLDPHPTWQHKCEMCLRCFHYCPRFAITYKSVDPKHHRYVNPNIKVSEFM